MKLTKIINLKKGDLVFGKPDRKAKKKKFVVAEVKEFKIVFDKTYFVNLNEMNMKEGKKEVSINFNPKKDVLPKLNSKKDLGWFNTFKLKNKMLNKLK